MAISSDVDSIQLQFCSNLENFQMVNDREVRMSHFNAWRQHILVALLGLLLCHLALSSSVEQVTTEQLVKNAAFVFEGEVTAVEAVLSPGGNRIHTYVTFDVFDIIKGQYSEKSLQLRFVGGMVGDLTLEVSDLHMPELHERGIYFVESLRRYQTNPLYGWDQGHFLIQKDANGEQRVTTRRKVAVSDVQLASVKIARQFSTGVALGLTLSVQALEAGLTPAQFKNKIRELIRDTQ